MFYSLQTRRLTDSFEGLNSSLAQSTGKFLELQSGVKIAAQCMILKYKYCIHRRWMC